MTTATADPNLLDADLRASASAPTPVPAPQLQADRWARLASEGEAEARKAAALTADPSLRLAAEPQLGPESQPNAEPQPDPFGSLQADPSQRLLLEPQEDLAAASASEAAPAYIPEVAPAPPTRAAPAQRKTWREQRAERRRRRVWLEEVLAWILVPVILLGTWWFVEMTLGALGTSPAAILNGLSAIVSAL